MADNDSATHAVRILAEKLESHKQLDEQRFEAAIKDQSAIRSYVHEIKEMIREHGRNLQSGFERAHKRIDEEAATARINLAVEVSKVQGLVGEAKRDTARLEKWIYGTALTVVVGLLIYVVTNWGPLARAQ